MSKADRSHLLSSFRENVFFIIKQISDAAVKCTESEQSMFMTCEFI